MRLLDLFCGAGGAAMGYHQAGFDEIVGVDINPQSHYPFEFVQDDALEWTDFDGFDLIHASPPCQRFTSLNAMWNAQHHPDLLTPAIEMIANLPHVIENVPRAPLPDAIQLCGSMFRLGTDEAELRRHRLFKTSFPLLVPSCAHGWRPRVIGVYGGHGRDRRRNMNTQDFPMAARREAMEIDWMNGTELSEAVPPAYTRYIGRQFLAQKGQRQVI